MVAYCNDKVIKGNCQGHLGKYDSCRDEALDMTDSDEWTGDCDFNGHYSIVVIEGIDHVYNAPDAFGEWLPIDGEGERHVFVPAGFYIVHESTTGFVTVTRYETAEAMRHDYAIAEAEYVAWQDEFDNMD